MKFIQIFFLSCSKNNLILLNIFTLTKREFIYQIKFNVKFNEKSNFGYSCLNYENKFLLF